MTNGGRTALGLRLFVAAAVARLALFTLFPGLPDLLTGRVEVSTPVTSFKRCMISCRPVKLTLKATDD